MFKHCMKSLLGVLFLVIHTSNAFTLILDISPKLSPESKRECTKQFMNWCKQTNYSEQDMGEAELLIDYYDLLTKARVICGMDSEGIYCIRDGYPWFQCDLDGSLTYQGMLLTDANSTVDDFICETKTTAKKLDHQLGFNKTAFETGVKKYTADLVDLYKQSKLLNNMVDDMQRRIYDISPEVSDVDTVIKDAIPLRNVGQPNPEKNSTETTPSSTSTETPTSSEIRNTSINLNRNISITSTETPTSSEIRNTSINLNRNISITSTETPA